jgi:hydroxymethylpyrimidine/phosphomethylpyrimidine kinase
MGNRAAQAKTGADLAQASGLPGSKAKPVLLTVAGFDPSSGAGITADLQVFWNHGFYGVSAITGLTVQSTLGVMAVEPVRGDLLRRTLDCLAADLPLAGVKIGMLGNAEVVGEVAAFLRRARIDPTRVVLDPVLRSSSGAELLAPGAVEKVCRDLLPLVGWVTPNLDELAALTGRSVPNRDAVPALARDLADRAGGKLNLVVTGGHLDPPDDFLLTADGQERWFPGRRIETTSTHGTGCAFSSALLCRLVLGDEPAEAVAAAKAWVARALESAVPIGTGRGPVLG